MDATSRCFAAGDSRLYTLFPVATGLSRVRVETPIPENRSTHRAVATTRRKSTVYRASQQRSIALKWRGEQVDVVRHQQDTIRNPPIQAFQGLAERTDKRDRDFRKQDVTRRNKNLKTGKSAMPKRTDKTGRENQPEEGKNEKSHHAKRT
jgi:hypothetical protein